MTETNTPGTTTPTLDAAQAVHLQHTSSNFVTQIEQGIGDPKSLWFGRRDLLEQAKLAGDTMLRRAGVAPAPPPDPFAEAQAIHDRMFDHPPAPALVEMMDTRIEALGALGTDAVERAATELRERMTPATYDALVAEAKAAFPAGTDIPRAVFADRHVLELTAARGRFENAYRNTKPRR